MPTEPLKKSELCQDILEIYSSGSLISTQILCVLLNIFGALVTAGLINFFRTDPVSCFRGLKYFRITFRSNIQIAGQ